MRAADHLVDLGPGAGEHGGEIVAAGHGDAGREGQEVAHRPVPGRHADDRRPREAAHADRPRRDPRRAAAQPQVDRRRRPARRADDGDRGVRVGQVDARQRGAVQGGRQPPAPRADAAGRAHGGARPRPARQDHPGRPVADRAHAAVEPGDVHGPVRHDPRPVRQDAGGAGARLQAGPLLVQRQGRALRGLPRRRADQDRDALPARRVRAVRAVPRQALQQGDPRHPLQGEEHRRDARDVGRGGRRVLPAHPEDPAAAGDAERRRARLHPARASRRRRCRAARRSA